MQALADSHKFVNELSTWQFIRAAYMWRFRKDITDEALLIDTEAYDTAGKVPSYISDYLMHIYGAS